MNPEIDLPYPPRTWLQSNLKPLYLVAMLLLIPIWLLVSWLIFTSQAQQGLRIQIENDLTLFADSLDSELEKYRFVPKMLIMDSTMANAITNPNMRQFRNIYDHLQHIRTVTTADEVFLLDTAGDTLASTEVDNRGLNYAHTPYFKAAKTGTSGGFFTLGVNAGIRGYYFSEPLFDTNTDDVIGVVVVKVNMSRLERGWLNRGTPMMITDEYGVVIAASVPSWLFTTRARLNDDAKAAIQATSKYPTTSFPLLQTKVMAEIDGARIVSLPKTGFAQVMEVNMPLPQVGWQLYGHADLQQLDFAIQRNTAISLLLFILTLSLAYVVIQRRLQFQETLVRREINQQRLEQAKDLLEVRVTERTKELQDSHDELKRTQTELIHAAKLATLGQMATSVTHEINQPLTAIQTTAENAEQWLQRENYQRVEQNLSNIKKLAHKMAAITSHLKTFGRKTDNTTSWVRLDEAINNAVELVTLRCKQEQVELVVHGSDGLLVKADLVRLEQVLINLLTNALDAMQDSPTKKLSLNCVKMTKQICIRVTDTGTGIDADHLEQLFDPFFTTKSTGAGLGLGLSISYSIIEAMGGSLTAHNRPQGGAEFCLRLTFKEPHSGA